MSNEELNNEEESLMIVLDGQGLDDSIYEQYDLSTLEDLLADEIEPDGIGELDGNEVGPEHTIIYLYGPSVEELLSKIMPVLTSYPLCKQSRVIVRQGGPGSQEREIFPQGEPRRK